MPLSWRKCHHCAFSINSLVFAIILLLQVKLQDVNIGTLLRQGLFGNNSKDKLTAMIKGLLKQWIMLLFAILTFSTMLDAGLFDPINNKMIRFKQRRSNESSNQDCYLKRRIIKRWRNNNLTLICCSHSCHLQKLDEINELRGSCYLTKHSSWTYYHVRDLLCFVSDVSSVKRISLAYLAPGMTFSVLYVIFFCCRSMGKNASFSTSKN